MKRENVRRNTFVGLVVSFMLIMTAFVFNYSATGMRAMASSEPMMAVTDTNYRVKQFDSGTPDESKVNGSYQGSRSYTIDGQRRNFAYFKESPGMQIAWLAENADNGVDASSVHAGGNGGIEYYFYMADGSSYWSGTLGLGERIDGWWKAGDQKFATYDLGTNNVGIKYTSGKWYKTVVRLSDMTQNPNTSIVFDMSKIGMVRFNFFHYGGHENKFFISDIKAVDLGSEGVTAFTELTGDVPDLTPPVANADNLAAKGVINTAINLAPTVDDGNYSVSVKGSHDTAEAFTVSGDHSAPLNHTFTAMGDWTLEYTVKDEAGNSVTFVKVIKIADENGVIPPSVSFAEVSGKRQGDNIVLTPIIDADSSTVTDSVTVQVTIDGVAGEVNTLTAPEYTFTLTDAAAGSYSVKYTVNYTYGEGSAGIVEKTNTFIVKPNPNAEKIVNIDIDNIEQEKPGSYEGTRKLAPNADGTAFDLTKPAYYFTGVNSGNNDIMNVTLNFATPVNLTTFHEDYVTLQFWMYIDKDCFGTNTEGIVMHDSYGNKKGIGKFQNISGYTPGKYNLVSIYLDKTELAPLNFSSIKSIQLYQYAGVAEEFDFLISGFRFIESDAGTHAAVSEPLAPVFTAAPMTIEETLTGGAYTEKFNILPTVNSEHNYNIVCVIKIGDKVLDTVTVQKADTAKLSQYSFLTGAQYSLNYTLKDDFGNESTAVSSITITGKSDAAKPVINVPSSFKTEYGVDEQIILSVITASDFLGGNAEVSFAVKGPDGKDITVTNNKFIPTAGGKYKIIVTAVAGEYENVFEVEINVTAPTKKGCTGVGFNGSGLIGGGLMLVLLAGLCVAMKKKEAM